MCLSICHLMNRDLFGSAFEDRMSTMNKVAVWRSKGTFRHIFAIYSLAQKVLPNL